MTPVADALVIGAGPSGSATAILLATAGWRVVLVERQVYPRQKVCGECLSAGSLGLLDDLGLGAEYPDAAGPELRRIGWMGPAGTVLARFPPCEAGPHPYGRAVGRDRLDESLLNRARRLGVEVLQPFSVRRVLGHPGRYTIDLENRTRSGGPDGVVTTRRCTRESRIVIAAHGSWEAAPDLGVPAHRDGAEVMRSSDLFAFKAVFMHSGLPPGILPVIAFEGGYGGIVVSDSGRTTIACCIRRDRLRACRQELSGAAAGAAVCALLRRACPQLGELLDPARRAGPWLSVGPIRPGIRVSANDPVFRVGNAAGETHPLIGEGISMALQSAFQLAGQLLQHEPAAIDRRCALQIGHRYAAAWRRAFAVRIRVAACFAQVAMRPALAGTVQGLVQRWPTLLTLAALAAGKARRPEVTWQPPGADDEHPRDPAEYFH